MALAEAQWTIVHGDSSRSPVFAVCTRDGTPVDLEEWVVRAQARGGVDSIDITYGWSAGHGIELSTGKVQLSNGRRIETSTVGLSLLPGDFSQLPREWSGLVEIEIASDSTTSPAERYTVARIATRIVPDITHDIGALIVAPGLPAPSAPAGGVLAGSYPNPIFAVPMMSKAETEDAIAAASAADRQRGNHIGTQSADTLTDGATKRAFLATERDKLAGIPADATHNSADAYLLNRANHTGSMFSTGVQDFAEAVQDTMAGSFVEGINISIAYNDANGTFTIAAANQGNSGGSSGGGGVSGVRVANGNTQAFTNELLKVDASGGPVTITPPPSPPMGTQVTVVKSDSSSNAVTWSAPVNGTSSYTMATRWSGATFTYDATAANWTVTAVSAANLTYADILGEVPNTAIPSLIARDQEVTDAITAAQAGNRARANHTGTQAISTVSGLQSALDARAPALNQVTVKATSYTAAVFEAVPLDTTNGSITLTLPTNAPVGTQVGARWTTGAASPLISAPTGETIGASQTQTMNLAPSGTSGEFIVWQKWTSTVWLPVGGFKPQAALQSAFDTRYDARYQPKVASAAFRAQQTTAQAIPNATDTVVSLPSVTRSSSLVTAGTQGAGSSFTIGRAGVWTIGATARLAGAPNAGSFYASLIGGGAVLTGSDAALSGAAKTRSLTVTDYFDANTVFYAAVFQNSGSAVNTDPGGGIWVNFRLTWIRD